MVARKCNRMEISAVRTVKFCSVGEKLNLNKIGWEDMKTSHLNNYANCNFKITKSKIFEVIYNKEKFY